SEAPDAPVHKLINDVISTRGSVGLVSLIGFIWFSTRLFGTLRTVLGELFDIQITVVGTVLFVIYSVLNAYLKLATTHGRSFLERYGLAPAVMSQLEYIIGTVVALATILVMFFALYKFLPNRRIRWQSALVAAAVTSVLFELAKIVFTSYVGRFNPGSLYTGTLYGLVIMVVWVYYAAVIFILG